MNKLLVGVLVGLGLAVLAISTLAAGEPPDQDRVCACNRAGYCMWVLPRAVTAGLTVYDDEYCGNTYPQPTSTHTTIWIETPEPGDADDSQDAQVFAPSLMMSSSDVCSIDECSAHETQSAALATMAAAQATLAARP